MEGVTPMSTHQVGDHVTITNPSADYAYLTGKTGTVIRIYRPGHYHVRLDDSPWALTMFEGELEALPTS